MFGLIDVHRALPAQARHAKGPTQRHLDPGDIERQGMKIEKPLADEVPDILKSQNVLVEHGDPLGTAAADHLLDRIRVLEVKGLQS
ncbi:hypothetical protein D3C84_1124130 [compost metagenome]